VTNSITPHPERDGRRRIRPSASFSPLFIWIRFFFILSQKRQLLFYRCIKAAPSLFFLNSSIPAMKLLIISLALFIPLAAAEIDCVATNGLPGVCISTGDCSKGGGTSDPARLCPGGNDIQVGERFATFLFGRRPDDDLVFLYYLSL
jgi:hypothetical protein